MLLRELLEADAATDRIPNPITAYHGGTGFTGEFNLNFSGSGEGYRILGPGIYFVNNKRMAVNYAKNYAKSNPTLYTAIINTTNFYNAAWVPSNEMIEIMNAISKHLGYTRDTLPRSYNSLTNGRGFIGDIVKLVGHQKAISLFQKYGLNGAAEEIDAGVWELSVFNLDMLKIISREPLTDQT